MVSSEVTECYKSSTDTFLLTNLLPPFNKTFLIGIYICNNNLIFNGHKPVLRSVFDIVDYVKCFSSIKHDARSLMLEDHIC